MSVIKINPAVMSDKRDAMATAWNEGLRLWIEDNGFEPQFEFTPEQQTFFAKTAYSQDAAAMRKTIVARIATRDNSVPQPTPEQISETMRLLSEVGDSIGKFNKDAGVVKALAEDLQARAPAPEEVEEPEAPETEGTEQMAQGAGDVQTKGLYDQLLDVDAEVESRPLALKASKIKTIAQATMYVDQGSPKLLPKKTGEPAPKDRNPGLVRTDGTAKGTTGFLGLLPGKDGGAITEYSINGNGKDARATIPMVVPTLTPDEVLTLHDAASGLPKNKRKLEEIGMKATLFARERAAQGKPYFFDPKTDKEKDMHPGFINMMQATGRIPKDIKKSRTDLMEQWGNPSSTSETEGVLWGMGATKVPGTNRADLGGDVQEADLLNNQMLARSLTETEGRYVGGYMDSASKSKPGVLTVGEGLTYVTDEKGVRAPVTQKWLAQFKDKGELDKALQTQNARFLLGVQKKLEPKLSQMDPATQALVANVAFNRGEAKASEYADMILAVPVEKRHTEALSRLAIAGTPRGKAKGTIGIAKGRYEHLVENLVSPDKALAYGDKWKDPKFREEVVAKTEAGTAAYVGRTHDKWAAKTRPADFAKLSAINARFTK